MSTPTGLSGASHRGLCPLAAAQLPTGAGFQTDGSNKYGVYSLFPGGPSFGSTLYSHTSTIGRFASSHLQQSAGNNSHLAPKDVLFPSWGYTFGTPTPPPGSPYSPIPVTATTQLELFAKSINSSIIIQQQQPADLSQKGQDNHCDDKCCTALRPQRPCNCQVGSPIKILRYQDSSLKGCSRTNPLDWSAVDVKKEPDSYASGPPIVKLELASPCRRDEGLALRTSYPAMASAAAGPQMGGALIQCGPDERAGTGLAGWQVGGACQPALAAPTLWQYPATLPVEPVVSVPVPVPPVGFQLVRDPSTGGLLLLPTTGIEPLQQTVVWPGYQQPSSMLLPSLSQISPPPLQLLSSTATDYLSNAGGGATTHQHTQTNGARLLTLTADPKKKMPLPIPTTLIKIETEASKTVQQTTAPLVAAHVIYQHQGNLILSQTPAADASPVPCLTPPPEAPLEPVSAVQDASNQTDTPICSEDDNTEDVPQEEAEAEVEPEATAVFEELEEEPPKKKPDLSGLELLTNSIMEIESHKDIEPAEQSQEPGPSVEELPLALPPPPSDNLGGLNLLCALAEQRIMEESDLPVAEEEVTREHKRKKKKSRKTSHEPERKKRKSGKEEEKGACSCQAKCYKSYRTAESEEGVKKFLASKSRNCCESEWPCMNAMEMDMRMKLADLQRQYREKQEQLSKLKPKDHALDSHQDACPSKLLGTSERDEVIPAPAPEKTEGELQEVAAAPRSDNISSDIPSTHSSSKKRKVEKPKKLASSLGGENVATETIVAKKPKTSFVGYLLKAKEKFKKRSKSLSDAAPLKYLDEPMKCKAKKTRHSYHDETELKVSKMRPKLKAEATLKPDYGKRDEVRGDASELEEEEPAPKVEGTTDREEVETRFTLTPELLEVNKLRVLTAMGGLFYAGQVNALEPPDVYSITLDGERGNKPHIMSREEILRDAIVEVSPKSVADIPAGTRMCAYWSQQYRCLYPGSVAEPGTPDPQYDKKFISVEFDDGDSGTIAIEDIRLLPPDYPIIEYDPNPLLSLCKRRRRVSTSVSTEEKPKPCSSASISAPTSTPISLISQTSQQQLDQQDTQNFEKTIEKLKDRKRAKKKKHKKLHRKLLDEDKKKKKKHKCKYENCKHRKHHKKHRKHKKSHEQQSKAKEEQIVLPAEDDADKVETDIPEATGLENVEEEDWIANPEYEVTMDDVTEAVIENKCKKMRERQESSESKSKMSAFLPARQLWGWAGKGYKRQKSRGRFKKAFYRSIQRGKEIITVGDSAVFLSTGRPDRPYIGKIEAMFELSSTMVVRVKWFYHPEETVGCPENLQYPGALFESPHVDENDVQTISHKCEVLPLRGYRERLGDDPMNYAAIYNNNDVYYLAGYYDPTAPALRMEPGIPFARTGC